MLDFIKTDNTGYSGLKKIGYYDKFSESISSFDEITYEGVFLTNKKYTMKRNPSNKRYMNILNALNAVEDDRNVKLILTNYFKHNDIDEEEDIGEEEDDVEFDDEDGKIQYIYVILL